MAGSGRSCQGRLGPSSGREFGGASKLLSYQERMPRFVETRHPQGGNTFRGTSGLRFQHDTRLDEPAGAGVLGFMPRQQLGWDMGGLSSGNTSGSWSV